MAEMNPTEPAATRRPMTEAERNIAQAGLWEIENWLIDLQRRIAAMNVEEQEVLRGTAIRMYDLQNAVYDMLADDPPSKEATKSAAETVFGNGLVGLNSESIRDALASAGIVTPQRA